MRRPTNSCERGAQQRPRLKLVGEASPVARTTAEDNNAGRSYHATGPAVERLRLAVKVDGRILFIDIADIAAIEAQGNYVVVRRVSGSLLLRISISRVEEELALCGFVRVHRSLVVNSAWVMDILPSVSRDGTLRLRGGAQYPVSRSYKKNLRLLAQVWLGINDFADDEAPTANDKKLNATNSKVRDDINVRR